MGNRFEKLVPPSLKYTDYCVINELEAQQATEFCCAATMESCKGKHQKSVRRAFSYGSFHLGGDPCA